MNINHTRDLVRIGNTFYDRTEVGDEQRKKDLERLSLYIFPPKEKTKKPSKRNSVNDFLQNRRTL
jgi:hypothetical protein